MRLSSASGTLTWNPTAHGSDTRVDNDATIALYEIVEVFTARASAIYRYRHRTYHTREHTMNKKPTTLTRCRDKVSIVFQRLW
jgi:hypothetical protein